MSKNVKILQDGQEKTLNKVSKIQTQLTNGLTCNWIPEDEVPLGELTVSSDGVYNPAQDPNGPYYGYSKVTVSGVGTAVMGQLAEITITKNGTYSASADNDGPFYGYSKVIVNVKSSDDGGGGSSSKPVVPGKDSDGDDAVVTTDDDGNIVTEKLPVEIRVITTPDNLEYEDGQSIVFDGLYVKAFYPDGTEYDSIPTTDLIRPVRVAETDGSSGSEWSDEQGLNAIRITYTLHLSSNIDSFTGNQREFQVYCSDEVLGTNSYGYPSTYGGNGPGTMYVTRYNDRNYAACIEGDRQVNMYSQLNGESDNPWGYIDPHGFFQSGSTGTRAGDGAFAMVSWENILTDIPTSTVNPANVNPANLHAIGSQQVIPLQWERPGDKKVLETSFTISVHASDDSGDSGGSGSSSGPQPQPTPQPS